MTQYWLVGAWWGGVDDRTELFIKNGYCENGWGNEKPNYAKLTNEIRQGDRIAIKKRASNRKMIEIRALGIIAGARAMNQRVDVDWLKIGLRHKVGIRGCVGTISGPFSLGEDHRLEWVRRVFLLDRFEHVLRPEELLDVDAEAVLAQEGGRKLRVHLTIERNQRNTLAKKKTFCKRNAVSSAKCVDLILPRNTASSENGFVKCTTECLSPRSTGRSLRIWMTWRSFAPTATG